MSKEERITTKLQIVAYMHCKLCLDDKPDEFSPAEWSSLDVGWTPFGLQVWCRRHNCNVANVDFQGLKHPAITYRENEDN